MEQKPMSYKKRLFFFGMFTVIFLMLIPVVLLYSLGYRLTNLSLSNLTNGFTVSPTGGAYVYYSKPGASIYVDGVLADSTSLFKRGVFIENLKAGSYTIKVEYPNFRPWQKTILVENQHVVETYPYLIRNTIATTSIEKYNSVAEEQDGVINEQYTKAVALFTIATTSNQNLIQNLNKLNENLNESMVPADDKSGQGKQLLSNIGHTNSVGISDASTTEEYTKVLDARGDIQLVLVGTTTNPLSHPSLEARYKGSLDNAPLGFCLNTSIGCTNKITLLDDATGIKNVSFYFGRADVFIYSNKYGVYVSEFDSRTPRNGFQIAAPLYTQNDPLDFRIKDGQSIVVKDGTTYYNALIQ